MRQRLFITAVTAFLPGLLLAPLYIRQVKRLALGQHIREEGPQKHLKKAGTPTMGGVIFLLASLPATFLFAPKSTELYLVLLLMLGNGLIGFIDDYLGVVRKQSLGLRARDKLFGQTIIVMLFYLGWRTLGASTEVMIPFTDYVRFGVPDPPFTFLILGFTNAVNLTDGVDGLAVARF